MRTASLIAACLAAYLIGLATAPQPKPVTVDSFPQYRAKVAECDSLAFSLNMAREAQGVAESKLAELQAHPQVVTETIHVRDEAEIARLTAELQKARQRPEALLVGEPACAEGGITSRSTAVPSAVPYQPRRRLFGRVR